MSAHTHGRRDALRVVAAVVSAWLLCGVAAAQQAGDAAPASPAAAKTLSELVEGARRGSARQRERLKERERRFVEARDERAALFADIKKKRVAAEAVADALRAQFEQGETDLAELETMLDEQSGDLREVFTVVRQTAGDALPMVQNSLVSAEVPGRAELAERAARADYLPTAADIRALWLLFLDEMNQSGRISRFDATVIGADGTESSRRVTRIGTFTAVADGKYLRYLPDSGRLLALARQPAGASTANAAAFEAAAEERLPIAIDPSRGTILSLIVQAPDLEERIEQGGIIGYVIIGLGALGLLLGAWRFLVVMFASRRIRRDLRGESSEGKHAVAQLRRASADAALIGDADAQSAKMDEIVTFFSERLRWGLPTLALFAAISPLLGLLGTVTGMIETFQVITLFGAGDPRLMSGGISQALVTTQLGLTVAIPLLLLHSFVQGRANASIALLDETAAELFASGRVGGPEA